MAQWRKVIVSGSAAELSSLTLDTALPVAQGGIGATSLTVLSPIEIFPSLMLSMSSWIKDTDKLFNKFKATNRSSSSCNSLFTNLEKKTNYK